jgi:branched-chain amino acid transport system permease protein
VPELLAGGVNLGFMFLPIYRGWVIVASLVVCFGTWYMIERTAWAPTCAPRRTRTGAGAGHQRAAADHRHLRGGVALAAFAGVLAAPVSRSIR